MKSKITSILLILIIFINIFMPILTYAGDEENNPYLETEAYYSSVSLAVEDANNNTIENADSNVDEGVASLVISNNKATIRLLKDCDEENELKINNNIDLYLNGKKMNFSAINSEQGYGFVINKNRTLSVFGENKGEEGSEIYHDGALNKQFIMFQVIGNLHINGGRYVNNVNDNSARFINVKKTSTHNVTVENIKLNMNALRTAVGIKTDDDLNNSTIIANNNECEIESAEGIAVFFHGNGNGIFDNNKMKMNSHKKNAWGIVCFNYSNTEIKNNEIITESEEIIDNENYKVYGIFISLYSNSRIDNNEITIKSEKGTTDGIFIEEHCNVNIKGNQIISESKENTSFGIYIEEHCNVNIKDNQILSESEENIAYGIYTAAKNTLIEDSSIKSISRAPNGGEIQYHSYGIFKNKDGKMIIKNSNIISDSRSNNYGSDTYHRTTSTGIKSNSGELKLYNVNVKTTDYGVATSIDTKLYVKGGTFETYGHAPFYLSNGLGENYIEDATLISQNWDNYDGEFKDCTGDWVNYTSCIYMGGGDKEWNSGVSAYLNNCVLDYKGEDRTESANGYFVLRGTSGEKNINLYISNSKFEYDTINRYRIDDSTDNVYFGSGNVLPEIEPTLILDKGDATENNVHYTDETYKKDDVSYLQIGDAIYKKVYVEGEKFDRANLEVKYIDENNEEHIITDYEIENEQDELTENQTYITVKYNELELQVPIKVFPSSYKDLILKKDIYCNFDEILKNVVYIDVNSDTVRCIIKNITGIKVVKEPNKTNYVKGENLNLEGVEIALECEDGTTGVIEVTKDNFAGYDANIEGEQTITVSYTIEEITYTTTFTVNVRNDVAGIEVTKAPDKTSYVKGEELDLSGIEVTATFEDETTEVIELPEDKFTGYDKNTLGDQTVTVTYAEGITAEFGVNVHNNVTAIEVTKTPDKTSYVKGEDLDLAGIEVTATYEDGTTGIITVTADKFTGYDKNTLGDQTVTVTYAEGITAEFGVNVHNNVTAIAVTKAPDKTSYVKGEDLDLAGIEVTATYEDGTTGIITVTADKFTGYDKNTLGEQTVTITYGEGITAEFGVNVHNNVTAIAVTKAPNKTNYVKGEDLNLDGIEVTATYEDGTTGLITLTSDKFTGYDKNTLGDQTVTVTYGEGITAEFGVNVHNNVTAIEVTKAPDKTSYVKGEDLNLEGIEVTATYEDGTTDEITVTADKVIGYDKNALGDQTVTVTYGEGITAEFGVNVHNNVTAIEVTKAPDKTSYVKGEDLNLEGIEVTATYEDGTTDEITVTADKVIGYDKNTLGEQTVTVTYGEGMAAIFTVNVHNSVTGIEVTKAPNKTNYVKGEDLNLDGIEVTATYEDGTTGVIAVTADKVTGYDANTLGEQTVTITYAEGITAEFGVNVHNNVTAIEVTKAPDKTSYVKGEDLNLEGIEVTATYEDGTTEVIQVTADKVIGYDKNTLGEQTVTVTYGEGIAAIFTVNVHNSVTGIEVTKAPDKTSYVKGEDLNLEGIEVTATYEDGTTEVIQVTADKVIGYDKNTLGEQTVTVTYGEGITAEFAVNVHNNVTAIEVTKAPDKTSYVKGEDLNLEGIEVTATYEDGTTEVIQVTADKVTGYDKNALGDQTVTVTYGEGITAEFGVNVHNNVTAIEVTKAPNKTNYVKGEDLNLDGIEVTATYEDGTTGLITLTSDKFTGYDKNTLGEQTVTVTYGEGIAAIFTVNVHNSVTGIEVTKAPNKTNYVKGEDLNLEGIEVTATYGDGTTEVIQVTADKVTGYDKNTLGEQTVTVTYAEGKTAEFKVNVYNEVTAIEVTKAPNKTSYVKGEELNLAGIEVTATFEDGTTGVIELPEDKFTGYDKNTLGEQTVTVTYAEGKTAEFKVNVHNEVTGIETTKAPTKTSYVKGEELNLDGIEVTATYEDGTTGVIAVPADKFTGYDKNTLGEQTVTVTYTEGKTAEFKVNVHNEVTGIEITKAPTKTLYVKGEELNLDGIEVTATYEDGTTGVIELPADKFTGYDKNTLGEQTVTVTYAEGKTAEFKVNVHNSEINNTKKDISKEDSNMNTKKGKNVDENIAKGILPNTGAGHVSVLVIGIFIIIIIGCFILYINKSTKNIEK